jgi:3-phenylpropionate/trans-cinnamate dioxygenase ferredoxin subunit
MTARPRVVEVCPLSALGAGEVVRVDADPPIAVFNLDGTLMAIDDTCTHEDASLSEGWVEDCFVECPLHGSKFDLRTGEPDGFPAREPVRVHRVVVQDGAVRVEINDLVENSSSGNSVATQGSNT